MAYIVRLGSMTVVVPTVEETVDTLEKFLGDDKKSAPTVSTFDGDLLDIETLRGMMGD
jgi:hypothetical protein